MTIFRDPRVLPQLGPPTGASDCAFRCAQGCITWASDGTITPTIGELRKLAGTPTGGTTMAAVRDLVQHYGLEARLTSQLTDVRTALTAGYSVVAAINYRYLNATYPQLSGDRGFVGTATKPALHAVVLFGHEITRQLNWHEDHDPLHDARTKTTPKSNAMVRRKWIEECMTEVPSGVQATIVRRP